MGAAMHRHTGSGKPGNGHKLLNAKKAVLAGSMTSAFAAVRFQLYFSSILSSISALFQLYFEL